MQMRNVGIMLIACSLAGGAAVVQARELREGDKYMCSWGAGTAARAQELKLSGVSLYAARQKIQTLKFNKSWMRMMAMGITEQTYDSRSRLKPEAIRQSFYQDCVRYKVARTIGLGHQHSAYKTIPTPGFSICLQLRLYPRTGRQYANHYPGSDAGRCCHAFAYPCTSVACKTI